MTPVTGRDQILWGFLVCAIKFNTCLLKPHHTQFTPVMCGLPITAELYPDHLVSSLLLGSFTQMRHVLRR